MNGPKLPVCIFAVSSGFHDEDINAPDNVQH